MNYVQIMGGLGNQLFQYVFARYLEITTSQDVNLFNGFYDMDISKTIISMRDYSLDHFNIKHSAASDRIEVDRVMTDENYDPDLITGNTFFNGYWQDKKYFSAVRSLISYELSLKQDFITKEMSDIARDLNSSDSVAVHIRRTDYLDNANKDIFYDISINYYKSAVESIRQAIGHDPVLYIFSDDYDYITSSLDNFCGFTTILMKPRRDYEDLYLMSQAKHHIIANSTFGWWGAVLSENTDSITIAPRHWFKDRRDHDLYPDNWIILDNQTKLDLISVIIPAYNVGKYIDRCLKSIEEQTYDVKNLEIILIDDASTDDTLEHLEAFEAKYPDNVILIKHSESLGPGAARNHGFEYASGKYITFVDSDDFVDVSMIYRMYIKIREYNCDIVDCGYRSFTDINEAVVIKDLTDQIYLDLREIDSRNKLILLNCSKTSVWGKLYKREFIKKNNLRFVENLYFEDIPFSGLAMFLASSYFRINETLYFYFSNANGIVHSIYNKDRIHQETTATIAFLSDLFDRGMLEEVSKNHANELCIYCTTKAFVDPLALLINSHLNAEEMFMEIKYFKSCLLDIFPNAAASFNLSDQHGICTLAKHLLSMDETLTEQLVADQNENKTVFIDLSGRKDIDNDALMNSANLSLTSDCIVDITRYHYDTEHLLLKHVISEKDTIIISLGVYTNPSNQREVMNRVGMIFHEYPNSHIILVIKELFFDESDECLKMLSEMIECITKHANTSVIALNDSTYLMAGSLMPSVDLTLA